MGVIRVNLSDAVIEEINNKMKEINGDSVGTQVEMFLKPWINLINENKPTEKKKETTNEQKQYKNKNKSKIQLPTYVVRRDDGYRFEKEYQNKPRRYLSFQNKSLEVILEFYKAFKETGFDYDMFDEIKSRFKPTLHISYSKSNGYYGIQFSKNSKKYVFCASKNKDKIILIREYLQWLSENERLNIYEEAKGHKPKVNYFLQRIEEDVEYQQYLKNRKN